MAVKKIKYEYQSAASLGGAAVSRFGEDRFFEIVRAKKLNRERGFCRVSRGRLMVSAPTIPPHIIRQWVALRSPTTKNSNNCEETVIPPKFQTDPEKKMVSVNYIFDNGLYITHKWSES